MLQSASTSRRYASAGGLCPGSVRNFQSPFGRRIRIRPSRCILPSASVHAPSSLRHAQGGIREMHWHARSVHGIRTFWTRAVSVGWWFDVPRVRDFPSVSLLPHDTFDLLRFTHRFRDRPRTRGLDSIAPCCVSRSPRRARGFWSPRSCLPPSWPHPFRRAHLVAFEHVGGEGGHLSRRLRIVDLLGGSYATRIDTRVFGRRTREPRLDTNVQMVPPRASPHRRLTVPSETPLDMIGNSHPKGKM